MEKFSDYRDPGTGIQPFLKPLSLPNPTQEAVAKLLLPIRILIAILRTFLVLVLVGLYVILVHGVCVLFTPVKPLRRLVQWIFTSILARITLLIVGFFWIPVELASRKRLGRVSKSEIWQPGPGDVIVSNWVSWVELLWLAFRFDPIFVFPVPEKQEKVDTTSQATPLSYIPGRRTGTGSANISSSGKTLITRIPISKFVTASLLSAIRFTGSVPPHGGLPQVEPQSLEDIRRQADRPIVVFPECTTSNGRGLLRVANLFHKTVPVKEWKVFVMCVRYDPPTTFSSSVSLSISSWMNPLPHLFQISTSLALPSMSIRLLAPSESPSSPLFISSENLSGAADTQDQLAEVCGALIAQIGRFKRIGLGWEDKAKFLEFYRRTKQ